MKTRFFGLQHIVRPAISISLQELCRSCYLGFYCRASSLVIVNIHQPLFGWNPPRTLVARSFSFFSFFSIAIFHQTRIITMKFFDVNRFISLFLKFVLTLATGCRHIHCRPIPRHLPRKAISRTRFCRSPKKSPGPWM